ncbi:Arm DNA-binding domain-containing protein [Anaerobutyricum hallii]|uniref:Arm DNA-binding domain-containing protein n=1 Tax=Anaerobutyricum hallii TaxID=39488 RepID=UPI00399CB001
MSAYKDKTQGTWYVSFRYIDWTGKKTQKLKRGFKTKKEALNYEKEFIRKTAADMKMEMNSFIQVYFEDKKNELKENSIRNKQHMMNKHIVPYFGTRKMNEITPAEIMLGKDMVERLVQDDIRMQAELEAKKQKEQMPKKIGDRIQWARERSEEHNAQIKKNKTKYRGMEL